MNESVCKKCKFWNVSTYDRVVREEGECENLSSVVLKDYDVDIICNTPADFGCSLFEEMG
jgi:hypothetical protein